MRSLCTNAGILVRGYLGLVEQDGLKCPMGLQGEVPSCQEDVGLRR